MSGIDREKLQGLISNWRFGMRVATDGIERGLHVAATDLEKLLESENDKPKTESELAAEIGNESIPVKIWRKILPLTHVSIIGTEDSLDYAAELHTIGHPDGVGEVCAIGKTKEWAFYKAITRYIESFDHSDLIGIEKITITEDADPFSMQKMWGFSIKERPPSLLAWSGVEKTITEAAKIAISEMITHLNLRLREKHGKES